MLTSDQLVSARIVLRAAHERGEDVTAQWDAIVDAAESQLREYEVAEAAIKEADALESVETFVNGNGKRRRLFSRGQTTAILQPKHLPPGFYDGR